MTASAQAVKRALARVPQMDDPAALRALIRNARDLGAPEVEHAAFARLCAVQPSAEPGTLEHDVWSSIFATEEMLREERGRTTLLSRTRRKIAADGEAETCASLTLKPEPSDGFRMLVDRGHPELLFEAVVLRHPDRFPAEVAEAARARLATLDPEPDAAPSPEPTAET